MKKYMSILMLMVATATSGFAADYCCPQPQPSCPPVICKPAECCPAKPWFSNTSVGIAMEENQARVNFYLFTNGVIKERFFYELRGYGIVNFITAASPVTLQNATIAPIIDIKEQKNQYGTGAVGIFGYILDLPCSKAKLTPFVRIEARSNNTAPTYRDGRGNRINTWTYGYYVGLNLNMPVNDVLTMNMSFYGGYQRLDLNGKGFFGLTTVNPRVPAKHAHVNQLFSNFLIGMNYNINKCWYIQGYTFLSIVDNNPTRKAYLNQVVNPPATKYYSPYAYKASQLTAFSINFGVRLGYKF